MRNHFKEDLKEISYLLIEGSFILLFFNISIVILLLHFF